MNFAKVQSVTASTVTPSDKAPPWGPHDLNKLRLLMNEGLTAAEMARALGTTITDINQKVSELKGSSSQATSAGSPVSNPPVGNTLDIKI